jgi:glyoxylase-like metal-dependent hydrolase (beta-lactamase superfamily II)
VEPADLGIALVRAPNPGPLTLSGTNTWVLGRDPAWVVDPGPAIPAHLDAVAAEVGRRGGAGGIAVTHGHPDHAEAAAPLAARLGARVADASSLADGDTLGPLRVLALPGHASDHLVFVAGRAAFTGDAVLGEGSVFVSADLAAYLAGLRRLRALDLALLCPGHGDPVSDVAARLDAYLAHRSEREARLTAALHAGARGEAALLDAAWAEVPEALRPAAALTLRAHLAKLREEGRLPDGADLPPASWRPREGA